MELYFRDGYGRIFRWFVGVRRMRKRGEVRTMFKILVLMGVIYWLWKRERKVGGGYGDFEMFVN